MLKSPTPSGTSVRRRHLARVAMSVAMLLGAQAGIVEIAGSSPVDPTADGPSFDTPPRDPADLPPGDVAPGRRRHRPPHPRRGRAAGRRGAPGRAGDRGRRDHRRRRGAARRRAGRRHGVGGAARPPSRPTCPPAALEQLAGSRGRHPRPRAGDRTAGGHVRRRGRDRRRSLAHRRVDRHRHDHRDHRRRLLRLRRQARHGAPSLCRDRLHALRRHRDRHARHRRHGDRPRHGPRRHLRLVCIQDDVDFVTRHRHMQANGVDIVNGSIGFTLDRPRRRRRRHGTIAGAVAQAPRPGHPLRRLRRQLPASTTSHTTARRRSGRRPRRRLRQHARRRRRLGFLVAGRGTSRVSMQWDAWPITRQDFDLYVGNGACGLVGAQHRGRPGQQPATPAVEFVVHELQRVGRQIFWV